jgi:hypothetical protein
MMYGLYFVVCVLGSEHCENRVHFFDEQVRTPMQCITVAQAQLAEWTNKHPNWRVESFRCGKPPKDSGTRI